MSAVTVYRKKVYKKNMDKMIVLKITVLVGQNQKGLLIPVTKEFLIPNLLVSSIIIYKFKPQLE